MISPLAKIHATALISEYASIADNVEIGPFCIVESGVTIGSGTKLISNVIVKGNTTIGINNTIYSFAVIGEVNQDLKYGGEDTRVEIGNDNSIREHCTIHIGTITGTGVTKIGSNNLLMVNSHVAHDCVIGNRVILANNATLAGHVTVGDFAIIGGLSGVHQFCVIGAHVMVGACSMVTQDIPPFVLCQGNHAVPYGVNIEGLRKRSFTSSEIAAVREAYRLIYKSGKSKADIVLSIEQLAKEFTCISFYSEFFKNSTRGIIKAK